LVKLRFREEGLYGGEYERIFDFRINAINIHFY